MQDDFKGWCLENPGNCIFFENMEERIFDNIFDILGEMFDLYKISTMDDSCYTDLEIMAQIRRIFDDMGQIMSSMNGFDYKWDQSVQRKHIKKKAFHTQLKDAIKNYQYKNVDPLELVFPDLYEFVKGLEKTIDQFFEEIAKMQRDMIKFAKPQPYHKKHNPHPSHHNQHKSQDPFASLFEPAKHHHDMFQQKYDPFPDMMNFMKPTGPPKSPMTHWGHQFQMPAFEQPKFELNNFKLF